MNSEARLLWGDFDETSGMLRKEGLVTLWLPCCTVNSSSCPSSDSRAERPYGTALADPLGISSKVTSEDEACFHSRLVQDALKRSLGQQRPGPHTHEQRPSGNWKVTRGLQPPIPGPAIPLPPPGHPPFVGTHRPPFPAQGRKAKQKEPRAANLYHYLCESSGGPLSGSF